MKKYVLVSFILLAWGVAGCAGDGPSKKSGASLVGMGDVQSQNYEQLWSSAQTVTARYFKIQRADKQNGVIITEPRIDQDADGMESKRGFITLVRASQGFDVKVEIPYLIYQRFENVYSETMKEGKRVLVVEKKLLEPPSKTDVYLESLLRSQILHSTK